MLIQFDREKKVQLIKKRIMDAPFDQKISKKNSNEQ